MNSQPGGPGALGQITKKKKQLPCDDGPCPPVYYLLWACSAQGAQNHLLEYQPEQAV